MDVYLLVDKVRCCERDVELTGGDESVPLHSVSVKVTGDAQINCGGLRCLQRGGYKWCGDWGRGGDVFAASWLLMTAVNLFNGLFIARVACTCSLSLFSICWNLSSSMAGESMTCWRLLQRWNRG
jgi:hypothetical protein